MTIQETFTKEEVIEILENISGYKNLHHWEMKLYEFTLAKKFKKEKEIIKLKYCEYD